MKTLVLFLSFMLLNDSLSAQDTWNDYVIGRPMVGYYDAKKAVAKEWGINYQVIFAGCVLSDEISEKADAYQKSNTVYFESLATKHGKDWKQNFEFDVKKERYRTSNSEKGIWYEVAEENKSNTFYTTKKAVAKSWGISYEVVFLTKNMSASEKTALTERLVASQNYLLQLENALGSNWQEKLNEEVELELTKETVDIPNNIWTEYVFGRPNIAYFDAKKAVAKEWGINYEVQFKNCSPEETIEIDAKNAAYFKLLEQQHGKDWKQRFDKAIEEEIAKSQLNKD